MSTYKVKTSVGCGAQTCVKERVEENEIPNHQSKRPLEKVNFGSWTRSVGS